MSAILNKFSNDSLVSANHIAEILDISSRTVWLWTKIGKLPKPYKFGTMTRWSLNEVEEAILKLQEVTV